MDLLKRKRDAREPVCCTTPNFAVTLTIHRQLEYFDSAVAEVEAIKLSPDCDRGVTLSPSPRPLRARPPRREAPLAGGEEIR